MPAQAQLRRVLDLNREAMDAYTNLEIEQAMDLLQQALQTAERGNVTGSPLARTYVNLGVVSIGGMSDNGQGLQHFIAALRADSSVQLDPLTSSPDIQSVFQLAQNRVGTGGDSGGSTTGVEPSGGGESPPGTIPHSAISEQLRNTALPIFVAAPEDAPVGKVYVYYKSPGMREFRRLEMRRMNGGFGLELPCSEVMAPSVEYYIAVLNNDGDPMGTAGTPEQPYAVSIVTNRSLPPPALPGQSPPEQCSDEECPPGMPCNNSGGGGGLGDTCVVSADCRAGLSCADNFCVAEDEDDDETDQPGFFVDVGFTFGLGYASAGKQVDGPRPEDESGCEAGTSCFAAYVASNPDAPVNDCDLDNGGECVRVETPGFVFSPALRLTLGYWIIPRFAVAATVRFNLNSGQGTLNNLMLGLRAMVQLTPPAAEGLHVDAFIGSAIGQYQIAPPQNGAYEPYIQSGLNSVQVGSNLGYRFTRNVGIQATPEIHILFPAVIWAIDLTAAVTVSF